MLQMPGLAHRAAGAARPCASRRPGRAGRCRAPAQAQPARPRRRRRRGAPTPGCEAARRNGDPPPPPARMPPRPTYSLPRGARSCRGCWLLRPAGRSVAWRLLASGRVGRQGRSMQEKAARIVADPEWLAHRYDERQDTFHYRHLTRARHAEVGFATDDYLGKEDNPVILPREEAARLLAGEAPLHFVFHSAFCASTMLVRALDVPGSAMGISEPVMLNDMTGWRKRGADVRLHAQVMNDVLGQLARPFGSGEAVVLKPSNVFSGLAMGALHLRPAARALLLYSPIEEFLLSVARKGMWCRLWARELLENLLHDGMVDLGFEPRDYLRQTDLQVAGVGWLAQHHLFHRMAKHYGAE